MAATSVNGSHQRPAAYKAVRVSSATWGFTRFTCSAAVWGVLVWPWLTALSRCLSRVDRATASLCDGRWRCREAAPTGVNENQPRSARRPRIPVGRRPPVRASDLAVAGRRGWPFTGPALAELTRTRRPHGEPNEPLPGPGRNTFGFPPTEPTGPTTSTTRRARPRGEVGAYHPGRRTPRLWMRPWARSSMAGLTGSSDHRGDGIPDRLDRASVLVPHRTAKLGVEEVVPDLFEDVEVGAAQRRRSHSDDHVVALAGRLGHLVEVRDVLVAAVEAGGLRLVRSVAGLRTGRGTVWCCRRR